MGSFERDGKIEEFERRMKVLVDVVQQEGLGMQLKNIKGLMIKSVEKGDENGNEKSVDDRS